MTRIAYIEEYILVARNLSLTKAARQLNLTQPAVSKHMSALEKDLGVQLLARDKQSIALTNAGKEFLEYAETIAATYSLAKDRMKAIRHSRQIEVKIGGLYHGASTRRIVLEALGKVKSATFQFCDVDKTRWTRSSNGTSTSSFKRALRNCLKTRGSRPCASSTMA